MKRYLFTCAAVVLLQVVLLSLGTVRLSAEGKSNQQAWQNVPKKSGDSIRLFREEYRLVSQYAKLMGHPEDHRWFLFFRPIEPVSEKPGTGSSILAGTVQVRPSKAGGDTEFTWPIEVLPNKWLTAMTSAATNQDSLSVTFRVWGELTTFENRNYILPTLVATESLFGSAGPALSGSGKDGAEPVRKSFGVSVDKKDKSASSSVEKQEVLELRSRLRAILLSLPRPTILTNPEDEHVNRMAEFSSKSSSSSLEEPPLQGGATKPILLKDGYLIQDRVGRLLSNPQESFYRFRFESDGDNPTQAPMIIHPNRILEEMRNQDLQSNRKLRFRVTGRVSKYQGQNYILIRKALIVTESANLLR